MFGFVFNIKIKGSYFRFCFVNLNTTSIILHFEGPLLWKKLVVEFKTISFVWIYYYGVGCPFPKDGLLQDLGDGMYWNFLNYFANEIHPNTSRRIRILDVQRWINNTTRHDFLYYISIFVSLVMQPHNCKRRFAHSISVYTAACYEF